MKSFFILNKKFETIPFLIVSLCVLVLIGLGNWQLKRLKEKENFIIKIELNIKNPPLELGTPQTIPEFYAKVKLQGHFLDNKNIFLYGRRSAYQEKNGYYLLSPFIDKLGNIYLVSRAWIPHSAKGNINSFKSKSEETITAFVVPGEEKRIFIPENDKKNNIWFTLDLNELSQRLGITNKDFYLMQVNSKDLPKGAFSLPSTYLSVIRNDHLEYAITWYSLAGFLCIIYFLYNRNKVN